MVAVIMVVGVITRRIIGVAMAENNGILAKANNSVEITIIVETTVVVTKRSVEIS